MPISPSKKYPKHEAAPSILREDGTPLNYTLVNLKDWCKNTFKIINQLRINTDYSHHRYDVINQHYTSMCTVIGVTP